MTHTVNIGRLEFLFDFFDDGVSYLFLYLIHGQSLSFFHALFLSLPRMTVMDLTRLVLVHSQTLSYFSSIYCCTCTWHEDMIRCYFFSTSKSESLLKLILIAIDNTCHPDRSTCLGIDATLRPKLIRVESPGERSRDCLGPRLELERVPRCHLALERRSTMTRADWGLTKPWEFIT
jgi:hypothetical protein